jgi:Fe-S cluster assembly protein SufD
MEETERFLTNFSRFEKELGLAARSWPHELRTAAIERFAELGLPGPRDEEWKFTNLARLAQTVFEPARRASLSKNELSSVALTGGGPRLVFVNGRLAANLSTPAPGDGIVIRSLAEVLEQQPSLIERHLAQYARFDEHPFTALNTAFLSDGAFVHLPKEAVLREPIEIVFVTSASQTPSVAHPRVLVVAENNSQATLVQSYVGLDDGVYFTNAVTEIVCGGGANIDHYKLQRESTSAFHIETLHVTQGRASTFRSHAITLGGSLVRNEINAVLDAEGCECTLNGLYLASGRQHVDNHTVIDHAKPRCASHELYKGILDGQAHGVFNGKIFVRPDAQKTDAKQTNQTLLLSEDATINTKPQLEIFADDVKCTHGATVGQLSAEAVFYLRSRGIDLAAARSLLTFAFANDIIRRIQVEPLRGQLEALLLSRQQLPLDPGGRELS